MNFFALFIGIIISIIVIIHFRKTRLEKNKFAYSALLFTFPFYYFVFAIYAKEYSIIPLEFVAGLLFFTIVFLSLKLKDFSQFILLAIGYILHGLYDVTHNIFFINLGAPVWWPEFCGSIDIVIGLYLVYLAFKCRTPSVL